MRLLLPSAPAVICGPGEAVIVSPDGEILHLPPDRAGRALSKWGPPFLVHAPATLRRLGLAAGGAPAFDLLELFAFVLPAVPVPPTPGGLAAALDFEPPTNVEDAALLLPEMARALLQRLHTAKDLPINREAASLAARLGVAGWPWAASIAAALGRPGQADEQGLKIWRVLPEWDETALPPPPASFPVEPAQARARLAQLLGARAEPRPGQADYASACCAAFQPRDRRGDPHLVLAEAGTGTGKTLGYIAPASLWAERNQGAVWISTYTRHLQRQIDVELRRLIPDATERRRRIVVRKGRENYLCLLNYEEAVNGAAANGYTALVSLALVARWGLASEDGDLSGGDLPGWFQDLFGSALLTRLADRRGECIHAACPHYRKCFVEHTVRRARTAWLVVANHALVMAQAAWGGIDDATVPSRYVFDEGHHLFDAADSAFSAELSGLEGAELRRWLLGAEGGRSRARGLRRRMEEMLADRPGLQAVLEAALQAARALPAPGWMDRDGLDTGNPTEAFLHAIRTQVLARTAGEPDASKAALGDLECGLYPVAETLPPLADRLRRSLMRLTEPLHLLRVRLLALLDEEAETLDSAGRNRIEAMAHNIGRRALDRLNAWQAMLVAISEVPPEPGVRPDYIHFLRVQRRDGQDRDAGMFRHPLDPTVPFIATLAMPAHGMVITSATLRDTGTSDAQTAWEDAEDRVGASHLPSPAIRAAVASPFDYAAQTRCFVATDLGPDIDQLASAYRSLFLASGGGALGLFTAIHRLRAVRSRILPAMERAKILLLAQHCDAMDNRSLVDVFRAEEESCLLGTDAMRDGVDVPGRALRMVVFDRVPWPRPDILHRERRTHLSGGDPGGYDDRIARFRLRQAFGRLIRSGTDRGVFVLLDRRAPSRLLSAFPQGVSVQRAGLQDIVRAAAGFLGTQAADTVTLDK